MRRPQWLQVAPSNVLDALAAPGARFTVLAPPRPLQLRLLGGYQNNDLSGTEARAHRRVQLSLAIEQ